MWLEPKNCLSEFYDILPEDADVPLDLQAALDVIHDLFSYDRSVDYRRPPTVPLAGEQADWVDRRLREKGLR